MAEPLTVLVVDDSQTALAVTEAALREGGYEVRTLTDPLAAVKLVEELQPAAIVTDIMMPGLDGLSLCKELKRRETTKHIPVVISSTKDFQADRASALQAGADAFVPKTLKMADLLEKVASAVAKPVCVRFWGTRGSLPVPGPSTFKYGGNTACVELDLPKDRTVVLDAGTGLRELGKALLARGGQKKIHILVTHPHWDHIQGLPFFGPAYVPGNEIVILGASHPEESLREILSAQMQSIHFPVTLTSFAARTYFRELSEGEYELDDTHVSTIFLNHPGITLGYRITCEDRSVCYMTDNELRPDDPSKPHVSDVKQRFVDWARGADLLIHDSMYTDEEYENRVGWGHSALSRVIELAVEAGVKRLALFHHDPDHDDEFIDGMLRSAEQKLGALRPETSCTAAQEGGEIVL